MTKETRGLFGKLSDFRAKASVTMVTKIKGKTKTTSSGRTKKRIK